MPASCRKKVFAKLSWQLFRLKELPFVVPRPSVLQAITP